MKENWTYKKLGEIAKISSGKAIPSCEISETLSDGFYPCYGGNGLRGYVDHYSHVGLTPVIGRVGALCGNVHLPQDKFYATEHALVVILKTNDKPHFIEYILGSLNLRQYAKGVAQPVLSASSLSDILIPIPPMEEQERIVAELDLLQSVIDKKKAQLDEYDKLAQSIFYEMFGDPIDNPKKWEVKKLGEIAKEKLSYGSGASAVQYNGEIRYVRITDIKDDGELNSDKVSPDNYDEKYLLNDGDILFARSGATVGKTFQYKCKYGKCIYAGYLIRLIPNINIVLPSYIFGFTKSAYYRSFVAKAQNAVAQPNINAKQYSDLSIPLPPLSLQQSFAEKIEAIEHQKELVKLSLNEVKTLFDSRMDYYFN